MNKLFTIIILSISILTAKAQEAVDISFTDINGVTHTLSEALAADKVIVLDFFFVDCPPCNTWAPEIDKIAADHEGKTVEIWAISDRDSDAYIESSIFKPTHANHFVGGSNGDGAAAIDAYAAVFNFQGFPTYSVVCKDNSITWDLWPLTEGVPEIRQHLTEECGVMDLAPSSITTIDAMSDLTVIPNPMADFANVEFALAEATDLKIDLVNNLGQVVQSLANQTYQAGVQQLPLDVATLANGVYMLRMQSVKGVRSVTIQVAH